jgi:hypothetical protein
MHPIPLRFLPHSCTLITEHNPDLYGNVTREETLLTDVRIELADGAVKDRGTIFFDVQNSKPAGVNFSLSGGNFRRQYIEFSDQLFAIKEIEYLYAEDTLHHLEITLEQFETNSGNSGNDGDSDNTDTDLFPAILQIENGDNSIDLAPFILPKQYIVNRIEDTEKLTDTGSAIIGFHFEINAKLSDMPSEYTEIIVSALEAAKVSLTFSFGTQTITGSFSHPRITLKSPNSKTDGEYWDADIAFTSDIHYADDCL